MQLVTPRYHNPSQWLTNNPLPHHNNTRYTSRLFQRTITYVDLPRQHMLSLMHVIHHQHTHVSLISSHHIIPTRTSIHIIYPPSLSKSLSISVGAIVCVLWSNHGSVPLCIYLYNVLATTKHPNGTTPNASSSTHGPSDTSSSVGRIVLSTAATTTFLGYILLHVISYSLALHTLLSNESLPYACESLFDIITIWCHIITRIPQCSFLSTIPLYSHVY